MQPTEQTALQDCVLALLRGIQKHSVIADDSGVQFREELAALESRLSSQDNVQQLVNSAVEILNKYGSQTRQALVQQQSGLVAAAERWTAVEEQIKAISTEDNLEAVKAGLTAQIASARTDALQVARSMWHGESSPGAPRIHIPDQLTGLPARDFAEAELRRAHAHSAESFLALFIVKRLALINAKFGYSRGDQVLLKVVVHLSQQLPEYNSLFRWAPCAFLALAPPNTTFKEIRGKVQLIELTRLAPTLEWEGRSAMVPVAIDCRVVSVKDFAALPDLFLRLDTLAADA